jgi:plasmid replication initiation protein
MLYTLFFKKYNFKNKKILRQAKDVLMLDEDDKENSDVLKPSGVIQIILTDNKKLSLMQRKAWNILIVNAYNELKSSETYKVDFMTICNLLGNNDINTIKQDLLKLMSTTVQFNYLKTRDKSVWEASTLLADARIENNDLCYSFGPMMRHKLSNLELYARINLSIQRKIDSKYTLILYELAKDHYIAKDGRGHTPFIDIDDLKRLMECHDEKSYQRFADFNRVIRKALNEINTKTDITVNPIYKRKGRSIASVQLQIKLKLNKSDMLKELLGSEQKSLPIEGSDLYNILVRDYKLGAAQAAEIIRDYEEDVIRNNIIYTAQQMAKGKVNENIPGFLYRAITENYQQNAAQKLTSVLPPIKMGMKIDIGGGEIETVTEDKVFRNSHNHIYAMENDIRLKLAAGKYKIVEEESEPGPVAELDLKPVAEEITLAVMPEIVPAEIDLPDIPDLPEIKPNMKISFGGVIFPVAQDKTIKNVHGYPIFSEKQLQQHIAAGSCQIVEEGDD